MSVQVKVQQNIEGSDVDTYEIAEPYVAIVVSGDDRELFINKTSDNGSTAEMVAMYAQGTWLRCWVEETADDADE